MYTAVVIDAAESSVIGMKTEQTEGDARNAALQEALWRTPGADEAEAQQALRRDLELGAVWIEVLPAR